MWKRRTRSRVPRTDRSAEPSAWCSTPAITATAPGRRLRRRRRWSASASASGTSISRTATRKWRARARAGEWDYFRPCATACSANWGKARSISRRCCAGSRERRYKGYVLVEQDVLPGMGTPEGERAPQPRIPALHRIEFHLSHICTGRLYEHQATPCRHHRRRANRQGARGDAGLRVCRRPGSLAITDVNRDAAVQLADRCGIPAVAASSDEIFADPRDRRGADLLLHGHPRGPDRTGGAGRQAHLLREAHRPRSGQDRPRTGSRGEGRRQTADRFQPALRRQLRPRPAGGGNRRDRHAAPAAHHQPRSGAAADLLCQGFRRHVPGHDHSRFRHGAVPDRRRSGGDLHVAAA